MGPAAVTVPAWTLRPIRPEEFEWAYELLRDTLGPYVDATWGWDEDFQRQRFEGLWPAALLHHQVIDVAGQPAGILDVEERPEEHPDELYLSLIEIVPAHQGRGLGAAIIEDLLQRAKACGLPLGLNCLRANPRARALYERLGLEVDDDSDPVRVHMTSRL